MNHSTFKNFTNHLLVGTRGSALALAQTQIAVRLLRKNFPKLKIETVVIKTTGDQIKDLPLSQIGQKGLFIKEIEEALLKGRIDLAVHSLKDLPTEISEFLCLGAVLKRGDPHDSLVSFKNVRLKTLPHKSKVGTSSLRRQAQILAQRPDILVENLRGNLETRILKLKENSYDAIVVARSGIQRLFNTRHTNPIFSRRKKEKMTLFKIPYSQMLPAVGQGTIAIEIRQNNENVKKIVESLNDEASWFCAICERSFLKKVEGGCHVPVGAVAEIHKKTIFLEGMIASPTGNRVIRKKVSGPIRFYQQIGEKLGEELLRLGGKKILAEIRN